MIYSIFGIKNENPEDFLDYLREEARRAEEMQKLTLKLSESEKILREKYIYILENGTLEAKVNLLASQYLSKLKFEQEKEEREWKAKVKQIQMKIVHNPEAGREADWTCPACKWTCSPYARHCQNCGQALYNEEYGKD